MVAEITEVRYYTVSNLVIEMGGFCLVIYAVMYALASTSIYTAYSFHVSRNIYDTIME
jgi:hypothetical protein